MNMLEYKGKRILRSRFVNIKRELQEYKKTKQEWRLELVTDWACATLKSMNEPVTKENVKKLVERIDRMSMAQLKGYI